MKFEIVNIIYEKRMFGNRTIIAVAQDEEGTIIKIQPMETNMISLSEKSIGILLNNEYEKIIKIKVKASSIKIGDIIE